MKHVLENENAPYADEHLNTEILNAEIMNGMDVLDEREKQVITLIYGLTGSPYTMAEIAYHMGLSESESDRFVIKHCVNYIKE